MLNALAHVSSGRIAPIPAALVQPVHEMKEQKDYLDVAGIHAAQEAFLVRGLWPGANGWQRTTGDVTTPADLPRFRAVIDAMAAAAGT